MRIKSIGLIVTAALFAVLVLPSVVSGAIVVLEAKMKGSEEPAGGDPNGRGTAAIENNAKRQKVCWTIDYKNIEEPFAAHIHKGAEGVDGPIKVPLIEEPFASGTSGCVKKVNKKLIRKINRNPDGYYVNVHNPEFPGGAIRGQLSLESSG